MKSYVTILIAGSSNGGKTSISDRLAKEYKNSIIIKQDDFFYEPNDKNHVWITLSNKIRHQNWERYGSIDWELFDKKLAEIHNELNDKNLNNDITDLESIKENVKLILIEGHVLLNHKFPDFFSIDRKIFFTLTKEVSEKRRLTRNYIPPDPAGYFEEYVWPSYLEHYEHAKSNHSDAIFIDGTSDRDTIFNLVKNEIDKIHLSLIKT